MNKLIKSLLAILTAFILCLMLNAMPSFAQNLKDSQRKTLPLPNSEATRCLTVSDCDRLIQSLVVELWKETAISQKAEKDISEIIRERNEFEIDRNKWRQLYTDEKEASTKLAAGNLSLTTTINKYKADDELDKSIINAQDRKLRRFRLEKFLYSGVSFGAGFGTGYFVGDRKNNNGVRLNF